MTPSAAASKLREYASNAPLCKPVIKCTSKGPESRPHDNAPYLGACCIDLRISFRDSPLVRLKNCELCYSELAFATNRGGRASPPKYA